MSTTRSRPVTDQEGTTRPDGLESFLTIVVFLAGIGISLVLWIRTDGWLSVAGAACTVLLVLIGGFTVFRWGSGNKTAS